MTMNNCTYDFSGKTCLVTGAAGGIGGSIAKKMLDAGANVALLDRNVDIAEKLASELNSDGERTLCCQIDIMNEDEVKYAVGKVNKRFGGVDILVNAAGILKHKPLTELSLDDFQSVLNVNLTGTFLMCREVVPYMKNKGRGKIVNIASLGGETARKVGVNYAASKAGVVGLTKCLAGELGGDGIYVNAVNPGPILTELTKQVPPEVFKIWNEGRVIIKDGLPEDVADAVMFLASENSDWITGMALDINGGIYI